MGFEKAQFEKAAALLQAMANPIRMELLDLLIEGERSVNALARQLGLSQSSLSQHLAKLRAQGLVKTRRHRQTIYYSCVSPEVRTIMAMLERAISGVHDQAEDEEQKAAA